MKKIKFKNYYLLILLITLSFSSCSEETCYSCDDTLNEWVIENKTLIESFNRSELIQLELNKQKAAYRVLSSEKRKEIWLDKILYVKENQLSNEEKIHFKLLEVFIEELDFAKGLTKKQESYVGNWFDEGRKAFNWDDKFLVKSFYFIDNNFRGFDDGVGIGSGVDCNCLKSSECNSPDDQGPPSFCTTFGPVECDKTFSGCGFLWLFSCVGTCT